MAEQSSAESPDFELPLPNPLSGFRSFNYVITLSCLSSDQVNFPDDLYKTGDLGKLGSIILRTGGDVPGLRVATANTAIYNPEGKFEYYINNLSIQSIMVYNPQTAATNVSKLEFEIIEPYSMGMLFQTIQIAALDQGHANYLEAPFLLTIEFIGHTDTETIGTVPNTVRHIPIKLANADLEVTAGGSVYKFMATAYNEVALNDTNNMLKSDMMISGKTVQEMLQSGPNSLQAALNNRLRELVGKEKEKSVPDEVAIIFPKNNISANSPANSSDDESNNTATANPKTSASEQQVFSKIAVSRVDGGLLSQGPADLNEIGLSKMGFDMSTGGENELVKDEFVYDEKNKIYKRGKIAFDATKRAFMFAQGTQVTSAITEVLLMSEYCKTAATGNKVDNAEGFKTWFKIETQVFNLESTDGNIGKGRTPRLIVFKVVPYKVHSSRFTAPTSPAKGYDQLKKQAAKEYNYIYTGKNIDLLDFKIQLNAGFQSVTRADQGQLNKDLVIGAQQGAAAPQNAQTIPNNENLGQGIEPGVGQQQQGLEIINSSRRGGGGATDDQRSLVARQVHSALLESQADLQKMTATVMGDPYYIADSGLGNFSNTGTTKKFNITKTGAMDYQSGEVDVVINFRTPIDIDPTTGVMDFGKTELVEGFSGLYHVQKVETFFRDGQFTQELDMVRRPKQNPKEPFNTSTSEAVVDETGRTSNVRRNLETGELYDASGLYDDQGNATVNPNTKQKSTPTASPVTKTSESAIVDADTEQAWQYPGA